MYIVTPQTVMPSPWRFSFDVTVWPLVAYGANGGSINPSCPQTAKQKVPSGTLNACNVLRPPLLHSLSLHSFNFLKPSLQGGPSASKQLHLVAIWCNSTDSHWNTLYLDRSVGRFLNLILTRQECMLGIWRRRQQVVERDPHTDES